MTATYGLSAAEWAKARDEIHTILVTRAKAKAPIYYSDLVAILPTARLAPNSFALHALLGDISESEDNLGRGMLSAFVISKEANRPGSGFYKLAEHLGRSVADLDACWTKEMDRVHEAWI